MNTENKFAVISSSFIDINDKGSRIDKEDADFIILSNHTTEDSMLLKPKADYNVDGTILNAIPADARKPQNTEIYYGFNGEFAHQLFAGETTGLIPVNNLNDVNLRARKNQKVRVFYTYHVLVKDVK